MTFTESHHRAQSRLSELIDESNQLIAILTTIIKKAKEGMK